MCENIKLDPAMIRSDRTMTELYHFFILLLTIFSITCEDKRANYGELSINLILNNNEDSLVYYQGIKSSNYCKKWLL